MPTNVKWTFSIEKNLYVPTEEDKQEEAKLKQQEDVSLLIEKLNYISQKENQNGNEKANIFYMYVLGITILGAAVSQLVAVHFQIKTDKNNFSISSPALDLVASALLIAAYILSRICFSAYIKATQNQIKWMNERNKIKNDKQPPDNNQYAKEIPYYVRNIMVWAGSLCLGGGIAILVITGGFLINVCRLQPVLSRYPFIITGLAFLIGFECSLLSSKWSLWTLIQNIRSGLATFVSYLLAKKWMLWIQNIRSGLATRISYLLAKKWMLWIQNIRSGLATFVSYLLAKKWMLWIQKNSSRLFGFVYSLLLAQRTYSLAIVVGFGILIFYLSPYLQANQSSVPNCNTTDPILASQVFIITGFCFFLIFVGCFVHFKRHIDMSIRALEINNNKTQK